MATFDGTAQRDFIHVTGDGHAPTAGFNLIALATDLKDAVDGLDGNDVMFAGGGNDTLVGSAGDDLLSGEEGDDFLIGGDGGDRLIGGFGFDVADYSGSGTKVFIDLGKNTFGAGAQGDRLSGVEGLIGSLFNDTLYGDIENNRIDGGDGKDTLTGGNGNDTLIGGDGDDWFYSDRGADKIDGGDSFKDLVVYQATADAIVVILDKSGSGGFAEGDTYRDIEHVTAGDGNDVLTGNFFDNQLLGNGGNDSLTGGTGSDTLVGGAGNDTVTGGTFGDSLYGGFGIDTYRLEGKTSTSGHPTVVNLAAGSGQFAEAGGDYISGFENIIGSVQQEWLIGSDAANAIDGNGQSDRLEGRAANDTLAGGAGNDTVDGGQGADEMHGGAGVDRLLYSGNAGLKIGLVSGTAKGGVGEGDRFDGFEDVTGGSGADTINGDDGDNDIDGSLGNDQILGNAGTDTLHGGKGDDVLEGSGGGDRLFGGEGRDTASYQLSGAVIVDFANHIVKEGHAAGDTFLGIENLLGSVFGDELSGDDLANEIDGDLGNDRLDGKGGNDVLEGGGGEDTLTGGPGADSMSGGTGSDIFIVRQYEDTGPGAKVDVIRDFDKATDKIDLSGVDASSIDTGNQAFAFSPTAPPPIAFPTPYLWYDKGLLQADTNNDGKMDFFLKLENAPALTFADAGAFIL